MDDIAHAICLCARCLSEALAESPLVQEAVPGTRTARGGASGCSIGIRVSGQAFDPALWKPSLVKDSFDSFTQRTKIRAKQRNCPLGRPVRCCCYCLRH